ncbi:MAG: CHASE domain-containing protein, partial [Lachnospiraceae bacterium]|nr:CHASE domain-containing protein [Candidatus Equihabitans merdae]
MAFISNIKIKSDQTRMDFIGHLVSDQIYETLLQQFSKARVLEAYLLETNGQGDFWAEFDEVAEKLAENSPIRNLMAAPEGVVDYVYPLRGNEPLVGLDLNENGPGNLEAQAAASGSDITMAGPFILVEGGEGIAGRLPVYLYHENGERYLWGLV